jgi:hypothetical protein
LYLIKKYKIFRAATLAAKPLLTQKHRTTRVAFVKDQFCANSPSYFDPQFQTIHIDEKWFQKKETRLRAYLADDEEAVAETVQHKSHIEKVMFLAAIARPRRFRLRRGSEQVSVDVIDGELVTNLFGSNSMGNNVVVDCSNINDNNNNWYFDGKVGLYPVVEETLAKRNSVNRKKGTVVLQPVSMTKEVYTDFVLNKLLPDIAKICPPEMRRFPIYIQHDNAPPHKIDAVIFNSRCSELGVDCQMFYQPAQSPDMNICDLSFFPSIQSLYYKTVGIRNIQDIINAVKKSFDNYDPNNLNRAFLSLFMNYNKVLETKGDNNYKQPHMGKAALERKGTLPITIPVFEEEEDDIDDETIDRLIDDVINSGNLEEPEEYLQRE